METQGKGETDCGSWEVEDTARNYLFLPASTRRLPDLKERHKAGVRGDASWR